MPDRIAIFWPGDGRTRPNELALPNVEEATAELERALAKLGRESYRIEGFLAKPHHAIERLGPIDDPLIGVCVHWFYGPHTTDGVVGKDNPLLLASNFSGRWPGLVGLLNTSACLESLGRPHSRIWTDARDWTADRSFMERLEAWCSSGRIDYGREALHDESPVSEEARERAAGVAEGFRRRRALLLMLGDTSMGMINGYFGPRLLARHGFTEHKVDQAWILDRGRRIDDDRLDDALAFVESRGLTFHWGGPGGAPEARDFDRYASREQLRDYLTVLDLAGEYRADCVGWQYQLGLLPLRPPSDLAEGLFNSTCRPEGDGDTLVCATEADQGNALPMEMLKRLLAAKGLHQAVMFHDVRWGAEHDGRFLWVLLNSGSSGAYAFNHDPDSLSGAHSYRQPREYFPVPGGTLTGESLPGEITWARAHIKNDELWMDVGRGEAVALPPATRDAWWEGTTRQWPFMAADLGIGRDALMAHYPSNHIAVAYGDVFGEMVALSRDLGFKVRVLMGEGLKMARYLGIDVGTGSARAGIYDGEGRAAGVGVHPIRIFRPAEDHVEQSSEDIWRACGRAVRAALAEAGLAGGAIAGIGFDATCSLVLLDAHDRPVTASGTGRDEQNVIVWMDHRALDQAARINATGHRVLRYVGGSISPEMQTPKLLWLKEHLPESWRRAARFFDLPDFLTYRATGVDTRSLCSATCKWTYLAHEEAERGNGWEPGYFRQVGLEDLAEEEFARIGTRVRPMGEPVGGLTAAAAEELGLAAGTPVGVSIIDAHAGGLGMLGAVIDGEAPDEIGLERRLALIGGTSSCHMAVSREPAYPKGIWGPYFSAMIPGLWLTEGGQSATGALIDHVVGSHARAAELQREAKGGGGTVYALLNERLDRLAEAAGVATAELTRRLHVMPDFHGNRSPRADPDLRGMISGLKLSDSIDSLALLYLAAVQAIAHGTRHIIDTMNGAGFRIDTLLACGGDTRNELFVREHADVTGCRILLPREPEAVLLGGAVLGAVASGAQPTVLAAMAAMNGIGREVRPGPADVRDYHRRKHEVFHRMYEDQLAYARLMDGP